MRMPLGSAVNSHALARSSSSKIDNRYVYIYIYIFIYTYLLITYY